MTCHLITLLIEWRKKMGQSYVRLVFHPWTFNKKDSKSLLDLIYGFVIERTYSLLEMCSCKFTIPYLTETMTELV
jgi:hypothetical protein